MSQNTQQSFGRAFAGFSLRKLGNSTASMSRDKTQFEEDSPVSVKTSEHITVSETEAVAESAREMTSPPMWWRGAWTGFTLGNTTSFLSSSFPALVLPANPDVFGSAQRLDRTDSAHAPIVNPRVWRGTSSSFARFNTELSDSGPHYLVFLSSPAVRVTVMEYDVSQNRAVLTCSANGTDLAQALEYYESLGAGPAVTVLKRLLGSRSRLEVEYRSLSGDPTVFGAPNLGAEFSSQLTLQGRELISTSADWVPPNQNTLD